MFAPWIFDGAHHNVNAFIRVISQKLELFNVNLLEVIPNAGEAFLAFFHRFTSHLCMSVIKTKDLATKKAHFRRNVAIFMQEAFCVVYACNNRPIVVFAELLDIVLVAFFPRFCKKTRGTLHSTGIVQLVQLRHG